MKSFIGAVLFICVAFSANAQLLWKVSGNGLNQPSYIIGTHHLAPFSIMDSIAGLQKAMKERDVPTMIYYMKPMHRQEAFARTDSAEADCPVTEQLCKRVLSLPMHPYMTEEQVKEVVNVLVDVL